MSLLARRELLSARLLISKQWGVNHRGSSWAHHTWARSTITHQTTNFSTTTRRNHDWDPSSSISLDEFLQKYKPSEMASDESVPWIWVRRLKQEPLDSVNLDDSHSGALVVKHGKEILEEYTKKIIAVRKDETIPTQADAEKGIRSKKQVKKELVAEATEKLRQLSQENKLTSGYWRILLPPNYIDTMFASLARDLITGDLSKTPAFLAKVSTTPARVADNPNLHFIHLYLPDIYDKTAATEVSRLACKLTGRFLGSAKSDFYTLLNLGHRHPSGIRSIIWSQNELVPEAELRELVETYRRNAGNGAENAKEAENAKKEIENGA